MSRINVYEVDEYGERTNLGWFDPEKSKRWDGRTEWDGNNMADVHVGANRGHILYRTPGGRWVLKYWSNWATEQDTYRFLVDDQAREWLLLNEDDDAVEEYFGELEEESGPGRPAIGPASSIKLGEDLTAKVDAAKRDGESRAAAIRRLLADALDPDLASELISFMVRYILRQRLKDHEPTDKQLVAKLEFGAEGAGLSEEQFAVIIAQAKQRADDRQASDPNWQDWCWR